MAPKLTEDEIDDLIYFARIGENDDLTETLTALAERENVTVAEILVAAKDESNKSTSLHMATGNGHLGKCIDFMCRAFHMSQPTTNILVKKLFGRSSHTLMRGQRKRDRPFWMISMSTEIQACIGLRLAAIWRL